MVTLRLKVLSHYGVVVRSQVAGFDEVSGVAVILIHRLLKNEVKASEHVLLTEPAFTVLSLPGDYVVRRQSYDGIGEVSTWLREVSAAVPTAVHAAERHPGRVIHVHYKSFVKEPVDALRGVFRPPNSQRCRAGPMAAPHRPLVTL